ncbi:hypothetical protein DICVIV_04164 [Dictyocaulus viviparus]|uniref:Uncharacterized protein n=1 Tax=Dictyocaulus viviparus TaxID=29172 RepID=A0A0D8Y0N4_DICVI|nr:hypothetical protein DICVIV_04164 [Dictyocaulus viviparus]
MKKWGQREATVSAIASELWTTSLDVEHHYHEQQQQRQSTPKEKSPIMQWIIGGMEIKQYQDCPVAVPHHFDQPEDDQLFREISFVRRLRHHHRIALFLGWSYENKLMRSLLGPTHVILLKYLEQIKGAVSSEEVRSTSYIPYEILFKQIWEIRNGAVCFFDKSTDRKTFCTKIYALTY